VIALPDINLLMALAWSHHPHHEGAHRNPQRTAGLRVS